MKADKNARFGVGMLVKHRLFDYRGVIYDVDAVFQGSDEWYASMARTRPPKDQPWYRVLVHDQTHETYVAERNLEPDESGAAVQHPHIEHYFDAFENGSYRRDLTRN
jgi:heat shock protein HspQ